MKIAFAGFPAVFPRRNAGCEDPFFQLNWAGRDLGTIPDVPAFPAFRKPAQMGISIPSFPFPGRAAWRLAVFLTALLPCLAAGAVAPPVADPPGYDGWIGNSTSFDFTTGILYQGRIMYTLDGSAPQTDQKGSTFRYSGFPITLTATTTVRAIHVVGGQVSEEAHYVFARAKAPTPVAKYGGSTHFFPSVPCTLSVAATRNTATLRYTLNDANPGSKGTAYTGPLTLNATTTLRAYASAAGYDDSDPLQVDFVLDPVATPVIDPPSGSFGTPTLTVRMRSSTGDAHIYFTTDPNQPQEKWSLMTGDSLSLPAGKDGDSIVLRARAVVSAYRTSPVQTAKYKYLPQVVEPVFTPVGETFYDTLTVRMTTTTASAAIRYTDDSVTTPTTGSPDGSAPVLLKKPATLLARAFKDNHDPSPIARASYQMRLSKPTVDKGDREFTDNLTIHLGKVNPDALIFFSLDTLMPAPSLQPNGKVVNGVQADPSGEITLSLDGVNVVRAIAVAHGVSSEVSRFTYVKKSAITSYAVPSVYPGDRDFIDTLSILLSSGDAESEVHYTLTATGRDPTQADPAADPAVPIRIDSSVVLRCRAFAKAGTSSPLLPSNVREARYTLKPSEPFAAPPPGEPFAPGSVIKLRTRTKNGIIHYAIDPETDLTTTQGFPDSVEIKLDASTTLYAVTVLGLGATASVSTKLVLHYDVYAPSPSDTLAPGSTRSVAGGFAYRNRSPAPALAKVITAESLGLIGFSEVSLVLSLRGLSSGQALDVVFAKPAGTRASLYRYADGKVEYVSGKDSVQLTRAGDYFTAVDIQPPAITIEKELPKSGDSTAVRFRIADNVANPSFEIASPGIPGGSGKRAPDDSGIVTVNLKGKSGEVKPLWLRAVSRDAYDSSALPPEPGGKIYVAQLWSDISTPGILVIGEGSGQDIWDLAGLPVGANAGLKWGQIRAANPDMEASVWRQGDSAYASLEDTADIGPGMAFWVGSRKRYSALSLPKLRAGESEADGTYRIRIKPGWNQVSNPSLDRAYWPITPAISKAGTTTLKAPNRYVRGQSVPWAQTDTLEPWIGYFVYYYGSIDTVVTIYPSPAARDKAAAKPAAAKASAGPAMPSIFLSLSAEGMPEVSLGARSGAEDAVGPEDEPGLPPWKNGLSAWSQRGARRLVTDWIRIRTEAASRWQVILRPGAGSLRDPRVSRISLPPGYQAWAISRTRGVKFRLESGNPLPLASAGPDTLDIFAGSPEALAKLADFSAIPERISDFAYSLEKNRGETALRLELPWPGSVQAEVGTVTGRRLFRTRSNGLLPGVYRWRLFSGEPAQILVLRIRYAGPAGNREFVRKFRP